MQESTEAPQSLTIKPLISIENMECSNKKKANFVCCSEKCRQNCFLCGDINCKCYLNHGFECKYYFLDPLLKGIQKQRHTSVFQLKQWELSLRSIIQLYDDLIKNLSQKKHEYETYVQKYFGIYYNSYVFIKTVHEDQNYNKNGQISGLLVSKMFNEISAPQRIIRPFSDKELKQFTEKSKKTFQLLQTNLDSLNLEKIFRLQFVESQLLNIEYQVKLYKNLNWRIQKMQLISSQEWITSQQPFLLIFKASTEEAFGVFYFKGMGKNIINLFSFSKNIDIKYQNVQMEQSQQEIAFCVSQDQSPLTSITKFLTKKNTSSTYGKTSLNQKTSPNINNTTFLNQNSIFGGTNQTSNLFSKPNLFGTNQAPSLFANKSININTSSFDGGKIIEKEKMDIFRISVGFETCISEKLFGTSQQMQILEFETYQLKFNEQF